MTLTLSDLDAFKAHLGVTTDDADARMQEVLTGVDQAVKRYCQSDILSAAATEYYDGAGHPELLLKRRPVTAVAGVWVDAFGYHGNAAGAFGDETEWTLGTEYTLRSLTEASRQNDGVLLAIKGTPHHWGPMPGSGAWPRGMGNVKVTYTAGYAETPADLLLALHRLAGSIWRLVEDGADLPAQSETIGKYSYSLLAGDVSRDIGLDVAGVRAVLDGYRHDDLF